MKGPQKKTNSTHGAGASAFSHFGIRDAAGAFVIAVPTFGRPFLRPLLLSSLFILSSQRAATWTRASAEHQRKTPQNRTNETPREQKIKNAHAHTRTRISACSRARARLPARVRLRVCVCLCVRADVRTRKHIKTQHFDFCFWLHPLRWVYL